MPGGLSRYMKIYCISPLSWRLCPNRYPRGEAVGFQSFRMRVFNVMGNRRLYNTKCIHMLGTPESELLKVAALNLFHPTASPPFQRVFFIFRHSLLTGEGGGEGDSNSLSPHLNPLPRKGEEVVYELFSYEFKKLRYALWEQPTRL